MQMGARFGGLGGRWWWLGPAQGRGGGERWFPVHRVLSFVVLTLCSLEPWGPAGMVHAFGPGGRCH